MFNLFKYTTPRKYADEFKETYSYINVKQIRTLSSIILAICIMIRLTGFIFYDDFKVIVNYHEYSLMNWVQITGTFLFLIASTRVLKRRRSKKSIRTIMTFLFVMFILSITFASSYIISLHHAQNTLTMFLVGIVTVSIFFALELKEISFLSFYVIVLFTLGISLPKINLQENLFSVIISIVLAFVLFSFSRYSYYFKSQHFLQVKQLEEKNMEVGLLNNQKSDILGFVAHDLRNPLNNIETLSEMMLMEENVQETVKDEINMVLDSARQAKTIIYDLLEIVAQSNKNTVLKMEDTDLIPLLSQICRTWQLKFGNSREIRLITEEENLYVSVHPSKFLRVIDNLIGNAIKFSPASEPILVSASKNDMEIFVTVTDFGIGIPNQLVDKLFDQFSKAGRPGLRGEKSIGLGLHICKQIIEQHSGKIDVKSDGIKGSSFIISLPPSSKAVLSV